MKTIVNYPFAFNHTAPGASVIDEIFNQIVKNNFPERPSKPEGNIAIDIWEKDNNLFIRASMPGIDPKNIEVSIEDYVLNLSGEVEEVQESEGTEWLRREVRRGAFSRSIRLPENVNLKKVEAKFQNGMVTISIPRKEEVKVKTLKIPVQPEYSTSGETEINQNQISHNEPTA